MKIPINIQQIVSFDPNNGTLVMFLNVAGHDKRRPEELLNSREIQSYSNFRCLIVFLLLPNTISHKS